MIRAGYDTDQKLFVFPFLNLCFKENYSTVISFLLLLFSAGLNSLVILFAPKKKEKIPLGQGLFFLCSL